VKLRARLARAGRFAMQLLKRFSNAYYSMILFVPRKICQLLVWCLLALLQFVSDCISMVGTLLIVIIAFFLPLGVYFAIDSAMDLLRGTDFWKASNIGFTIIFFCFPLLLMILVLLATLINERNAK
jgi:hypothetical protein